MRMRVRVEKVKPDPLNLSVNTVVGKQIIYFLVFDETLAYFGVSVFLLITVGNTI